MLFGETKVTQKLGVDSLGRTKALLLLALKAVVPVGFEGLVPVGVVLLLYHFVICLNKKSC